ncbi:TonB-dependent receptor [Parvicella tangerina]|uniref:Vitamin B12 transporter BtuB n=1 Tax=Parvicella tangerina TaxID=2829795 RepID=A0A916JLG3_9FLAO|nr:TonB-dependent receptor [Parvicella tangerina]CAG5077750.1 Vitamin B12 transporter BtuB [Parvicella tangerina]
MRFLIVLFVLLSSLLLNAQVVVSGYVTDKTSGEPLIGATIYEESTKKGTTTNVYGYYSIALSGDSAILKFSFVGYGNQRFQFALNEDIKWNVEMDPFNELNEVAVNASQSSNIQDETQMSSIDLSMDKVKALPVFLGEKDVMKTIQLLPGIQSGTEGASGIYVRGGGPDQNLILLDGVPVYNASHLFGFFSVFNADAINSVQLIKGGFPAHYGGRLSSVIDIRMKEGNMKEFHGEGSIGLISAKLMLEGPIVKDKTSFAISGRRTYIDLLARPLIKAAAEDQGFGGYFFYDLNAKLNHKFSDKSRLYASGYFGNDKFYATLNDEYVDNGTTYSYRFENQLKWGNGIAALRWNYLINPKLFSNTTLTFSKYNFVVGFSEQDEQISSTGTESQEFSFQYLSGIRDYSAKVDFDYTPHPDHYVKFGTGYTYHTFTPGVNTFRQEQGSTVEIDTTFGATLINASEFWAYAEDDYKITTRLKANLGAHFSGFIVNGRTYLSFQPRASVRFMLNENSSIKASYAQMAQFLHLLTNTGIGLPTDLWVPPTDTIKPQYSTQYAIGYAQTIAKKYELSVEGYYKKMTNLIEYKDGASFFGNQESWEEKIEVGEGMAYGAEILIEKKVGKTSGWIGYTLSWSNRTFENLNFGETFPYRYDRRHDIGVAITHKFNERVDIGVVWVYGTGNAVSLGTERYLSYDAAFNGYYWEGQEIEHIDSRNGYRMPSYHRLDIGVNLHKKMAKWERTWSFGVYNMYNRQNPFYLYFSYDDSGDRRLTQISLFPLIPSFSYSFKF